MVSGGSSTFRVGIAARNQLAAQPLAPVSVLDFGKASIMSAAPLGSLISPRSAANPGRRKPRAASSSDRLGPSDTSGNSAIWVGLGLCDSFRWVASINNSSGLRPLAASAAKIQLNTPAPLQRMERL